MAGARGGRRAVLPGAGWTAPEQLLDGGLSVRFITERNGREQVFDFAGLPVEPGVARWLARAFARRTGPRHGIKSAGPARNMFNTVKSFAQVLSRQQPAVTSAAGVTAGCMQSFSEHCRARGESRHRIETLRSMLRDDPELPAQARQVLVLDWASPRQPGPARAKDPEYTDAEWQQIMTALRKDVRVARDRIRAGRALLARYRAGGLAAGSAEEAEGRLLDAVDRTGDVPRYEGRWRGPVREVDAAGGTAAVMSRLCLTLHEMTAFALLLTALTGENFGTVAAWPAACYRPDGGRGDGPNLALIEEVKPRRGPEREHMVAPLEDLPPAIAEALTGPGEEDRLFRSPLRVYQLLLELTEVSRRHGGHAGAFSARAAGPGPSGESAWACGPGGHHVHRWARDRGFAGGRHAGDAGRPAVSVRRIRQTVTERRRRPVAHTRATMNDQYLMPSRKVRGDSQAVVAAALEDEVGKARARQQVPVFTAAFIARFSADPDGAAREAGLEAGTIARLLAGEQDTVLASCTDHLAGPHAGPGQPCPASFLSCLDCPNARALPRHLPAQVTAAEHIAALRPHLSPAIWEARFRPRLDQLEEIVNTYTPAERDRARGQVSTHLRQAVSEVLDGRWDLR
jgi:hypothetical protein